MLPAAKLDQQARRRMKAHASVCGGCFCERVSELGAKYTPTSDVGSQEIPARKSGDHRKELMLGTLDELSLGNHWKPQGDLRDPQVDESITAEREKPADPIP